MKNHLIALLAVVATGSVFAQGTAPVTGTLTTNAAGQVIATFGSCTAVVAPNTTAPATLAECQLLQQAQAVAAAGGGAGGGFGTLGTLGAIGGGLGALAYNVDQNRKSDTPISNN